MRRISLLAFAICCASFALPANALVVPDRMDAKAEKPIITVAVTHCPPGQRLVPAGYQRKGKWRPRHCSGWVSRGASPGDSMAGQLNAQEAMQHQGMRPPGSDGGAYGQPSPTQGIPGAWQSPASTHLPPGYR
jgi:hypothetical protein